MVIVILKVILIVLCLCWLFCSIYKQFNKSFLAKIDSFSVIPNWTLFAPRPFTREMHIGYRDRLDDGTYTELRLVDSFTPSYRFFLWRGQRRDVKFIQNIYGIFSRYKSKKRKKTFFLNPSVKMLKSFLRNYDLPNNSTLRQVVYFKNKGYEIGEDIDIIFVYHIRIRK